jgi:hypothetical protein
MATEFIWPIEEHAGSWESLEPWSRPLGGVRIEGEQLRFEYRKPYVEGRSPFELAQRSDFRMLSEFARLSYGDPAADGRLLSFATHYGALGLCREHGWPLAHTKPFCPRDFSNIREGYIARESIHWWLVFSHTARAIMTVLVEPRGARHDAELAALNKAGDSDANSAIDRWLKGGELKLRIRNRPSRLTLYGVPPLWTAIGLELATMAAGAKGIILCSACGRLDSVKRPRHNNDQRRAFCSKCRDLGRTRLTVADLRQRQKQARELHAQHQSVAEIAAQLGIAPSRVRRYLAKEKTNG